MVDDLVGGLDGLRERYAGAAIGNRIVHVERIGSTNDLVREELARGAPGGIVALADEQTAGRGRRGRTWTAPPGSSLLVSIGLRPSLPANRAYLLGAWLGVAAVEAIRQVAGLDAGLKWPNDVLLGEKKCGGILAETALTGAIVTSAMIGLGLNVNVPPAVLSALNPDATSLSATAGGPISLLTLLEALLERLNARYGLLTACASDIEGGGWDRGGRRRAEARAKSAPAASAAASAPMSPYVPGQGEATESDAFAGWAVLHRVWRSHLTTLGRDIWVHDAADRWAGHAVDLAGDGALVVRDAGGANHHLHAADVSIRPRA